MEITCRHHQSISWSIWSKSKWQRINMEEVCLKSSALHNHLATQWVLWWGIFRSDSSNHGQTNMNGGANWCNHMNGGGFYIKKHYQLPFQPNVIKVLMLCFHQLTPWQWNMLPINPLNNQDPIMWTLRQREMCYDLSRKPCALDLQNNHKKVNCTICTNQVCWTQIAIWHKSRPIHDVLSQPTLFLHVSKP